MSESYANGGTRTVGMNISLPEELARAVRATVRSGRYASSSEVMREALRRFLSSADFLRDGELAAHQHRGLDALIERLAAAPPQSTPDDGLSGSRDHDQILYGRDA